jgi:hypothetical protein
VGAEGRNLVFLTALNVLFWSSNCQPSHNFPYGKGNQPAHHPGSDNPSELWQFAMNEFESGQSEHDHYRERERLEPESSLPIRTHAPASPRISVS